MTWRVCVLYVCWIAFSDVFWWKEVFFYSHFFFFHHHHILNLPYPITLENYLLLFFFFTQLNSAQLGANRPFAKAHIRRDLVNQKTNDIIISRHLLFSPPCRHHVPSFLILSLSLSLSRAHPFLDHNQESEFNAKTRISAYLTNPKPRSLCFM